MANQTQPNLDAEINTQLQSGIDITAAVLRQVLHDMNSAIFQSGVVGFATPTALIGVVAQAGSSTSAMRSDGAPAINQTMTPVWTGMHQFASGNLTTGPTTGAIVVNNPGGIGVGGAIWAGGSISTGTLGTTGLLQMSGSISGAQQSITVNGLGTQFQSTGGFQSLGGLSCAGATTGTASPSPVVAGQRITGTVSGTVSTQDYAISVISGATITRVVAYTTTAFAGGTINLTAGTGIGDNVYIQAQDIHALGVVTLNLNGTSNSALSSMGTPPNFFIRLTQTGGPSVVGRALIFVEYLVVP